MAFIAPLAAALPSWFGTALAVGSSAVGAIAKSNADSYRGQVASNNAQIMENNAQYATKVGIAKSGQESMKGAAIAGRIKTAQAASGVDVNTGSAATVQESQRKLNKLDTETVMSNSQLEAYGYRSRESNYNAEARMYRASSTQDLISGALNIGGDMLGGAKSLDTKWSPPTSKDVPYYASDDI